MFLWLGRQEIRILYLRARTGELQVSRSGKMRLWSGGCLIGSVSGFTSAIRVKLCWSQGLVGSEKGFTFIETLILLALMGVFAVGLLSAMSMAFTTVLVGQERVTAESLAKSQLESIKTQSYVSASDYDPADPANCYEVIDIGDTLVDRGYEVEIDPPETVVSPEQGKFELQSITVAVERDGEAMITISEYKVGRSD